MMGMTVYVDELMSLLTCLTVYVDELMSVLTCLTVYVDELMSLLTWLMDWLIGCDSAAVAQHVNNVTLNVSQRSSLILMSPGLIIKAVIGSDYCLRSVKHFLGS